MDVILSQKKINNFPLIFCVIFLLFASCKGKIEKPELARPKDLMGRDTMVILLTEMHLLESSLGIRIFEDKKIINTRNAVKDKIYKDYGVSKERFMSSYNYYVQKSTTIDSIFTDVISEISKRQALQLK
mgnify:CR=1 FL=1|jgi:hypothetical protein